MSRHHIKLSCSLLLIISLIVDNASACTLTMGYRSNERLPLINQSPSNSGLYQHLYTLASEKIGCQLNIERGPKNRILRGLKQGKIDFYPGFNFTQQRADYVFFIENGLPGGDVGISLSQMETITNLRQLKNYTLLTALGSADMEKNLHGVRLLKIREMTIARAISLLRKGRGDFYIYNKSTIEYYLHKNNITDIKIHPDCCAETQKLYLGFSKKSTYYQQQDNPDFNSSEPVSVSNYPQKLSKDSVAYQFQQALGSLKKSGKNQELYEQYYK